MTSGIYTDKAAAARHSRVAAAAAAAFIGPPEQKPRVTTDDDGTYTVITGKACRVCGVQLTSRNQYGQSLLCQQHGTEDNSARKRLQRAARAANTSEASSEEASGGDDTTTTVTATPQGGSGLKAPRQSNAPRGSPRSEEGPRVARLRSAFESFLGNPTDSIYRGQFIRFVEDYAFELELVAALEQEAPSDT